MTMSWIPAAVPVISLPAKEVSYEIKKGGSRKK
jgi:hypothetical protein